MTPDELLERIRQHLGHPSTVREIMRTFKLSKGQAPAVRRALRTLVARGDLLETKGKAYGVPEFMDMVPGRITVHPQGYAFVRPEWDWINRWHRPLWRYADKRDHDKPG